MPQLVDPLVDAFRSLDSPMAEQATAVPKISCPSRAGRTALREPQTVEQSVKVPTVLTFIQQQTAEHNVDIPVLGPRPIGCLRGFTLRQGSQRTAEQNER